MRNTIRLSKSKVPAGVLKVLAVAALLVAVAVPVAEGSSSGTIQRITALEKKVKAVQGGMKDLQAQLRAVKGDVDGVKTAAGTLQTDVGTLKTDVGTLKQGLDCVRYRVVGVASYGSPSNQAGYIWAQGQELFLTTALDVAPAGQQQAWLAVVNPSCVSASSALRLGVHQSALRRSGK